MSLFDDASLVYIPTGYKPTKNYSGKPSTGGADMTFSRASGATRVNSKGLVEKVRTNELNYSNTFNGTGWTINAATLTSGQGGYDGSSDAWKLTESATTAEHYVRQTPSVSGLLTISIYAKADTRDWLYLRGVTGGVNVRAWFDLQNGVVGTTNGSVLSRSIQSVGGGWYRCSMTLNHQSGFECYFGISNADGVVNYAGDGTSSIYIQDAQLEYGLVATNYIETTSATVSVGPVNDEPRLTYDPVNPTAPSLLMEPQRTNLVTYSEYFGASNWILDGSAITTNSTTSPEGVANATKLEGDGSSVNVRLYDSYSYPSTGDYTFSVYAKAGTNDFVLIAILGVDGGKARYFDLVNGIAGSTDSKIEAIGTDGWYRCSFTATLTGPDTTGNFNIYVPYSIDTNSFPSAGDANGQYVYIYGAQLEQASYESSYIPTNGTSVTRVADASSKTGISDLIGQTEGTLFCEIGKFPEEYNGRILAISDGSLNNYITIIHNAFQDNLAVYASSGGVTQVAYTGSGTLTDGAKVAVGYKLNDYVIYINGTQVHTDTSAAVPVSPSQVYLGTRENGAATYQMGGSVSQALLFPTRIDNATLATLTSL